MIGYATIGVSDMGRAKKFYTDLFESKGAKVVIDSGRIAFLSSGRDKPMLAMCEPYDGNAPTAGNGAMIAFSADSKEDVDQMYARAIEVGATDDGKPGQRIPDRFYGAYVRDPDNNKLCFFVFG
ncbi:Glyoxalase/Bleomycin resistance protein/Dioxygenase superfamily protein [Sulfitobacter brevis]|uniref:Glyoxalase/Bleomycin resistance protein/Dioxygenase superfamily protein n=1 Tax=Sulfitobacter brevis TaxID=74348 RepID=A0A1I2AD28_9RHOB|nr:VOC family protein [Sulfitobacter brevis]SFE40740.1 Glyoxalase/Bleomycin resistance protein/Dioxygenase superfamily protein [Sulfitobacter brevis]